MSQLKDAFNALLGMHSRTAKISRPGVSGLDTPKDIRITPSNFQAKDPAVVQTIVQGYEFIISKEVLDAVSFPAVRRGDLIEDVDLGPLNVDTVEAMYDIGAKIMGFRVRTL